MTIEDIELLKLQIERDKEREARQERRDRERADLFKWGVAVVWPLIVNVVTAYCATWGVSVKIDQTGTAVTKDVKEAAVESAKGIKTELTAASERQDHKLEGIDAKAGASVLSWKAWQSKEPDDMNVATEAVDKAATMATPP